MLLGDIKNANVWPLYSVIHLLRNIEYVFQITVITFLLSSPCKIFFFHNFIYFQDDRSFLYEYVRAKCYAYKNSK